MNEHKDGRDKEDTQQYEDKPDKVDRETDVYTESHTHTHTLLLIHSYLTYLMTK